jgi:uncharacterized protein (TIGR02452 family)
MNRHTRLKIAEETVAILRTGHYTTASGAHVEIERALRDSVAKTWLVRPGDWSAVLEKGRATRPHAKPARIEVTPEATLAACQRLVVEEGVDAVAALNFASAKNPGGGFLSGSQAQEESLARSSGLYSTLLAAPDYYAVNRRCSSLLYTDHAIFSPAVPVFRDDDGELLAQPYMTSFITMPATNAGAISRGQADAARIADVMRHRMHCVFALAAATGQRALVLGAWGCGVFRNDPEQIASLFATCLAADQPWRSRFERIVFAVYDTTPHGANRAPFERHFASTLTKRGAR